MFGMSNTFIFMQIIPTQSKSQAAPLQLSDEHLTK